MKDPRTLEITISGIIILAVLAVVSYFLTRPQENAPVPTSPANVAKPFIPKTDYQNYEGKG